MQRTAIFYALASAALFGASTPLAKLLVGEVQPLALAGLLYLGSGIGLLAWFLLRKRDAHATNLLRADLPWLAGAILAGGVVGPALLMYGLTRTDGATASLLLNLEAVLTASIAWIVFRENVDRRVFLGMVAIVAGGVVLSWGEMPRGGGLAGPLLIAGACLAWAIDNNLTRRVSGGDAVTIAGPEGSGGGRGEPFARIVPGRVPARHRHSGVGRCGRVLRLRHQPGALRRRPAQSRHRAHRRLFFGRAVLRRCARTSRAARVAFSRVLDRRGAHGARRVAAPDGAP